MPRPGPRRPMWNFRPDDGQRVAIDADAERLGVTRSAVIRAALDKWAALPKRERKVGNDG